jgi:branched-chain amino acid transport system ATP-binding protein
MQASSPLLAVRNLSAGYFRKRVIDEVTFDLFPGEIAAVLGANGSGKSTLFKAIMGLLDHREGEIAYRSASIAGLPTHQIVHRGIAYLFQDRNVFAGLTVQENLELAGFGESQHARVQRGVFELFPEVQRALRKRVGLLSGGERQMLGIAMVLMRSPVLALLDEPSAGLSPHLVKRVMENLGVLNKEHGIAFLIIEQNIRAVLGIASRVFIMKNGRLDASRGSANLLLGENLKEVFFS